jgi:hypothetical protein
MARPTTFPIKKLIGFDPELWDKVREFRFAARLNTESEAVRRLIELGLTVPQPSAPAGGNDPSGASKPSSTGKSPAPRDRKPGRQAEPAEPQSKEAQIRALREQGGRQ